MKKVLCAIWVIAVIVFFVDWGIVGLSLLDGNYEIKAGIYVGLVCFIIILAGCLMYSPIRVQIYLCIKKAPEVYLHLRCFGLLCKLSFAGIVLVTAPRIRAAACSAVILPCIVRRITVVCRIVIRRVIRRCVVGRCIFR